MVWRYLTADLHVFLSPPWLQIVLALTSVTCGAIVGAERERREKPAGLRTLILVCLGATTFTLASYAFTSTTEDSGRVAAQIVTGIGFLGAGAILHGTGIVRGMTTAATIWAIAAMGMVVGIGYAGAGLGLSLPVSSSTPMTMQPIPDRWPTLPRARWKQSSMTSAPGPR